MTSEDIAALTVKAYEKNRLYVVPQASAKMQWFFKPGSSPASYYETSSFEQVGHVPQVCPGAGTARADINHGKEIIMLVNSLSALLKGS